MSLQSALAHFEATLDVAGLPGVEYGIPDEALDTGPYPSFRYEWSEERFEYGALQAVEITHSECDVVVLAVLHRDKLDERERLRDALLSRARAVRAKIVANSRERVYDDDGDRGFRCELISVVPYYRPSDPVAAVKLSVRLSQYE
jgi:hypothetical protein